MQPAPNLDRFSRRMAWEPRPPDPMLMKVYAALNRGRQNELGEIRGDLPCPPYLMEEDGR
ncbi:MAG: hypothetical protein H0Z34_12465 [Brevibacillus sp.]|nr:hypothetical protein [Brevibacillus sp.]